MLRTCYSICTSTTCLALTYFLETIKSVTFSGSLKNRYSVLVPQGTAYFSPLDGGFSRNPIFPIYRPWHQKFTPFSILDSSPSHLPWTQTAPSYVSFHTRDSTFWFPSYKIAHQAQHQNSTIAPSMKHAEEKNDHPITPNLKFKALNTIQATRIMLFDIGGARIMW